MHYALEVCARARVCVCVRACVHVLCTSMQSQCMVKEGMYLTA